MKTVLIFLMAAIACHALSDSEIIEQWQKFQSQHQKSYKSPIEATKRFQIFKQNLKDIEEHNARYQRGEVTYHQGVNQFSDMTDNEFLEETRCMIPRMEQTERRYNSSLKAPESIDWRSKDAVLTPQKQGGCGACWAFTTTGAVEAQVAIKKGKLAGLSKQNLIDCVRTAKTVGCEGGDPSDAFEYIKNNGVEYENEYPYHEKTEECHQTSFGAKISSHELLPIDESAIQDAVGNHGPISTGIVSLPSLKQYQGGIYSDDACTGPLNHAVLLVGYGSENGQDYWIAKNSWGEAWGENGFFRFVRGVNACNLNSQAVLALL